MFHKETSFPLCCTTLINPTLYHPPPEGPTLQSTLVHQIPPFVHPSTIKSVPGVRTEVMSNDSYEVDNRGCSGVGDYNRTRISGGPLLMPTINHRFGGSFRILFTTTVIHAVRVPGSPDLDVHMIYARKFVVFAKCRIFFMATLLEVVNK